jgi:O-6-methylguanine DNA methyltransferase
MEIAHTAEIETPVGSLRLVSTRAGLAFVSLPHASGRGFEGWLRRHAPGARVEPAFAPNREAARQILEYLEGKRTLFELALDLRATDFERAVYAEMSAIPYGRTRSYAELATALGRPRASRAVGGASAANPLSLVIPCHRVIASDGRLGGYGGGLDLKARLLAMERAAPRQGMLL